MTVIIDASVGVKWIVPEEDHEAAAALIGDQRLYAPALFFSEVGNALVKKHRRGEIVIAEVAQSFADLPLLITSVDECRVMGRAMQLATELGHSIYDCVYVALAEDMRVELVTADLKFVAKLEGHAARRHVVPLKERA
ncbi:type II toxin-antitoxin system VapC family toxin [Sphingomonas sp. 37zxx]|uniref:type II toxin-antitoxin system VapC family toxin n=1 Tax=Sphingomonas sp. 37zxx TaxID=1550073 RepID=UPI001E5DF4CD|nr:type II toxin-antitoxin system VapC family toxin [Sphingomonas sp. 37zxx]